MTVGGGTLFDDDGGSVVDDEDGEGEGLVMGDIEEDWIEDEEG